MRMTKSWTHRFARGKSPAVLMLVLLLLLCWCIPVRVSAEEADTPAAQSSPSDAGTETPSDTSGPDPSAGADDVDISTPLAPPPGKAEIVEVVDQGQPDQNQLYVENNPYTENTGKDLPMETEFENDSPSITLTETFYPVDENGDPDTTALENKAIDKDLDPEISSTVITETKQPINVPLEDLVPEGTESDIVRDGDALVKTTITESENAIQKAVYEALSAAESNTESITIRVAAGEYSGDIIINNKPDEVTNPYNISNDFILYILAEDSYEEAAEGDVIDKDTIHDGSQGNVVVTGNIIINHINVIMAGLYLSKGQNIVVEDATVTYNGTALADNFSVSPNGNSAEVTVNTGDSGDTVNVAPTPAISGYKNSTTSTFAEHQAADSLEKRGTVNVNTGSGNDAVNIDVAVAQNVHTVQVNAGNNADRTDVDRIHLTGDLNKDAEHAATEECMKLITNYAIGEQEADLTISTVDESDQVTVENFTDDLTGKPTTEVKLEDLNQDTENTDIWYYIANESFHNYVINAAAVVAKNLSFRSLDNEGNVMDKLFLANLRVQITDWSIEDAIVDKKLEIQSINAPAMNIVLEDKHVVVNGTITGNNITIYATDSDANISPTINAVTGSIGLDTDISLGLLEQSVTPDITIKGSLIADGSVVLNSKATATQPLLVLAALSPAAIKVAISNIIIEGTIQAQGSVEAVSSITLVQQDGNSVAAKLFIPISVAVLISENNVHVKEYASITAGGSVNLKADTSVKSVSRSTVGKLPVSLSLTIAYTDVDVLVEGTIISKNGDITLDASASSNLQTYASEKAPTTNATANPTNDKQNNYGVFFALAIASQDVEAAVRGNGSLIASLGNVNILSNSEEVVVTKAESAENPASTAKSQSTSQMTSIIASLIDMLKGGLKNLGDSTLIDKVKGIFGKSQLEVTGGKYVIDVDATKNGSVSAPHKSDEGKTVLIKVTPDAGYTIELVQILEMDSVTKQYTKTTTLVDYNANQKASSTDISFVMPGKDIIIKATFRKLAEGEAALPDGTGRVNSSVEDQLNNAGSNGSTFVAPENYGTTYKVGDITYEEATGTGVVTTNTNTADAGQDVLVRVTPSFECKLTALYLVTTLEGRTVTTEIRANAQGEYIFTMPAGNVSLKAKFDKQTAGSSSGSGSAGSGSTPGSQLVGAFAVGVVSNNNDAYIDTTGKIQAPNGTVKINATALTQHTTLADGSVVKNYQYSDPNTPQTQPANGNNSNMVTSAKEYTVGDTSNNVKLIIGTLYNGTVTLANTAEELAAAKMGETFTFKFTINAENGYKIKTDANGKAQITLSYVDANGKTVEVPMFIDAADTTSKTYMSQVTNVSKNMVFTVDADFVADKHAIDIKLDSQTSESANRLKVVRSANTGDTVTIYVNAPDGKAPQFNGVQSLTITSIGNNQYTFVMPEGDVAFTVSFVDYNLPITITGNLTTTASNPKAGDTVVLSKTNPNQDFETVTVTGTGTDANSQTQNITVTKNNDGTYSFVVPEGVASIQVTAGTETTVTGNLSVDVVPDVNGSITTRQKVNLGESLSFIISPNAGYMLKDNSLKIHIIGMNGTVPVELVETITKDANGKYTYTLKDAAGYGMTVENIKIDGDFVSTNGGLSAPGKSTFSAGVGINVTITYHDNSAYVEKGTITAKGLNLNASTGSDGTKLISSATSRAGYSQGDFGVAGALTVHVLAATTESFIGKGTNTNPTVIVLHGGELNVTASSVEDIITAAEGSGTSGASSTPRMGVGAGIAMSVVGVDVIAEVEEGLNLEAQNLSAIKVCADHSGTETMTAKAGSSGGISVTPVLALLISGIKTEATIGTLQDNAILQAAGDAEVSAQSAMLREMTANAAAAGGNVGVGGSFALSVVNDSARAHLRNSVDAGNVRVNAVSRTSMKSTSRAGSNGAASNASSGSTSPAPEGAADGEGDSKGSTEKSEADKQADKAISGGIKMAGTTGSGNLGTANLTSQVSGRQQAQTSEGNIQVAAAFVLNIQKNVSEAIIDGGIHVETPDSGKVSVNASNNTIAAIYGNASATKAKIGVGVAVAINVVTYDNLAKIGVASVHTGDLEVTALMYKDLLKQTVTLQNNQGNTILEKYIDYALNELFEELSKELDLEDVLGELWTASLVKRVLSPNWLVIWCIPCSTALVCRTWLPPILNRRSRPALRIWVRN